MEAHQLPDYDLLDLKLSQPLFNDQLSLYIKATNLLDENYAESESLPQAGRQWFVGVDWRL